MARTKGGMEPAPEHEIEYTGRDWVLILLDKVSEDMKQKFMQFWWCVWHHRNDTILAKGKAKISHSARFLQNYLVNLRLIADGTSEIDRKGKILMVKLPSVK